MKLNASSMTTSSTVSPWPPARKAELAKKVRELGLRAPARATKAELQEILDTAAGADIVDLTGTEDDDTDRPASQPPTTTSGRTSARCEAGRPLYGALCRDCIVSGLERCPGG